MSAYSPSARWKPVRFAASAASFRFCSSLPAWSVFRAHQRLRLHVAAHVHAEVEAHLAQDVLDLLERLPPEIAVLEHLRLALLDQVADGLDLGGAQTVARAHRQLQFVHALVEQLADAHDLLVDLLLDLLLDRLLEMDEHAEVVAQDL